MSKEEHNFPNGIRPHAIVATLRMEICSLLPAGEGPGMRGTLGRAHTHPPQQCRRSATTWRPRMPLTLTARVQGAMLSPLRREHAEA
jgi:hypothetical protein